MANTTFSSSSISEWCRSIGRSLKAGLAWDKTLASQARSGPPEMRALSTDIQLDLARGISFHESIKKNAPGLPAIVHGLVKAGEISGRLDQALLQLGEYYTSIRDMRRRTLARLARPGIQMAGAIFVVVVAMIVMGLLSTDNSGPTVLGASGIFGAMFFIALIIVAGLIVVGAWIIVKKNAASIGVLKFASKAPVIGAVIRNRTMWNFTTALHYTLDGAMDAREAIELSYESSGNAYFDSFRPRTIQLLEKGKSISQALGANKLLDDQFLGIVSVGETIGEIPESMARESKNYSERFEESMTRLSQTIVWGTYCMTGLFIIILIFRFASIYLNAVGA